MALEIKEFVGYNFGKESVNNMACGTKKSTPKKSTKKSTSTKKK